MGLNSVVGRPKEEYGMEPLGYEQMRRGTWDIQARGRHERQRRARLAVLSDLPGFAGQRFQGYPDAPSPRSDPGLQRLAPARLVQRRPGRFIPLMIVPWWDMQAAAAEINAGPQGVHAITLVRQPGPAWLSVHPRPTGTRCGRPAPTTAW
jgi:hypothetical protein